MNANKDSLMIDLDKDLSNKSFEELIYIHYNQEQQAILRKMEV